MESITNWLQTAILRPVPELDYPSFHGRPHGKLRLTPEQLLAAIHAQELAEWSVQSSAHFSLHV